MLPFSSASHSLEAAQEEEQPPHLDPLTSLTCCEIASTLTTQRRLTVER